MTDAAAARSLAGLLAQLGPEKRALLAELLRPPPEPIAVVGVGCRLPGGVDGPEALWDLLAAGVDAVTEVPPARWDVRAWADDATPERRSARWGAFLGEVDGFDHRFFGVAPREAVAMDPQQRLLLEVAWEALESAAIAPRTLAGARAGVFFGLYADDYAGLQDPREVAAADAYSAIGTAGSFAAGRVAYLLDLRGPAIAVDTACSSSLVAVHLACQSLRARESDLALAGGVSLMLSPISTHVTAQLKALAPDGRCRAFDARATGFVRGEGCGVLTLKRLADARAAGDPIWALIRGSAVGQDGRTAGITAPNGLAQVAVMREALRAAGVDARAVGYVEAHGTGTPLGDPIELEALREVYGAGDPDTDPCHVASIKTNLGHLEAAAGVVGVIKAALIAARGQIPPHLHFESLNPRASLAGSRLRISATGAAWPAASRIAAVSSFGMSGTNAHAIVEAPPADARPPLRRREPAASPRHHTASPRHHTPRHDTAPRHDAADAAPRHDPADAAPRHDAAPVDAAPSGPRALPLDLAAPPPRLLVLSARDDAALRALAARHAAALEDMSDATWPEHCATAALGRQAFERRLAVVATGPAEAARALVGAGAVRGAVDPERPPRVAFLCSGQGAQYAGMGRELYAREPVFRGALDECAAALDPHLPRPILAVMHGDGPGLDDTLYTQPALFALAIALAALWRDRGVVPAALLGHSVGEFAAAAIAGALTLADAARLIAERARRMHALPPGGGMLAVSADVDRVAAWLGAHGEALALAAVNAPGEIVIAGDLAALAALAERCAAAGVRARPLRVSHAFHSPRMRPMLAGFAALAATVPHAAPTIPLISNLGGAAVTDLGGDHWARHLLAPVRFADGVQTLARLGCDVFIELGPGAQLLGLGARCLPAAPAAWLPSIRAGRPEAAELLAALAALHVRGAPIAWPRVFPGLPRRAGLPTYPFQRERCWRARTDLPGLAPASPRAAADDWLYEVTWPEAPVPQDSSAPGPIAVFADRGGVAAAVVAALRAAGQVAVLAAPPDDPDPDAWARALAAATVELGQAPARVAHLAALGAPDDPPPAAVAAVQRALVGGALGLVQALVRDGHAPRVWLVTRGAVAAAPGDAPRTMQAGLWGLAGTAAFEHPELGCIRVDLDPAGDPVAALTRELLVDCPEGQVAWRRGIRRAARLRPAPPAPGQAPEIRPDATYLVTGGLRGLGLAVAGWLVAAGARHLALLARRPPDPDAARTLAEWSAAGVQVHVRAVDVGDPTALAAALAALPGPPLRGVLHAAGTLDDAVLTRQTWDRCWSVMAPKLAGAWTLHHATRDRPLEIFALFSSLAGLAGAPGQSNYAAANAALDALAGQRRAAGLAATSVAWGPWAVGMAAGARPPPGLEPFSVADGLAALARALASDGAHRVAVRARWPEFLAAAAVRPRLFADLAGAPETPPGTLRARLTERTGEARREAAIEAVREAVAHALGSDADRVPARTPLRDLGMDSLMAVQIRHALAHGLGLALPTTLVFEHPSVLALAEHLLAELTPPAPTPTPAPAPSPSSAAAIADLSDEQVEALLRARLPAALRRPGG